MSLESRNNPANWRLGYFYCNKNDKRMMVPGKNPKYGPTLNFASPYAYFLFIGVVIVVLLMAIVPDLITGQSK